MQKFILQPLEISISDLDKTLTDKIFSEPNLYILSGKSKVGKTAFCFKLINELFPVHPSLKNIGYFHFENIDNYWLDQYSVLPDFPISKISIHKIVGIDFDSLTVTLMTEQKQKPFSLIVIDGIYNNMNNNTINQYEQLLNDLTQLARQYQVPIILTERKDSPPVLQPAFRESRNNPLPEQWFLDRPEYYGINDIKEFGQTRLYIL